MGPRLVTEAPVGCLGPTSMHPHSVRHHGLTGKDRAVTGLRVGDKRGGQPVLGAAPPDGFSLRDRGPHSVVATGDQDKVRNTFDRDGGRR